MLIHIHTHILQAFINACNTAVHTHVRETHSHMKHELFQEASSS